MPPITYLQHILPNLKSVLFQHHNQDESDAVSERFVHSLSLNSPSTIAKSPSAFSFPYPNSSPGEFPYQPYPDCVLKSRKAVII